MRSCGNPDWQPSKSGSGLQRIASSPEIADSVEELKTLLGSEQFIDSLDEIAQRTKAVLDAYKHAYVDLFDRRKKAYESAIEEIKNRSEWGALEATNPETCFFAVVVADWDELALMRTRMPSPRERRWEKPV